MIELSGVCKAYKVGDEPLTVLHGIDLRIEEGEFVSIMGPSGSGKSTLMHIIGCLDTPSAGEYRLCGTSVGGLSARDLAVLRNRTIGFVFQNFHLLPRITAVRNVELPLLYAGVSRAQRRSRALELLARVGMEDRAQHLPTALSGGQKQRVAIARALANDPALILADEPTGALDQRTGLEIIELLRELHSAGRTIVVITHDPTVAAAADRTIYIVDGHIQREEVRRG
ncbi:ABC transporter ATP-binding protein [Alicyclobacillus hesperidum]|uniref:ABC transporter ATP-binding protein n=1 Tax=Alicyclobacillus hesperidum TaxID=89784 RepID=A0A1H2QAN5_9BACL|nr:ABC transporter ATP-binding protein [Alicyclobacillus hesperidum]GLV12734.1 ABC transporter ATP-binding protein [Alicyclobacillus hesperidum]SDW04000.1 putative ABC transport system ATP-binding protein [Alicyclobacillus hesperidum]